MATAAARGVKRAARGGLNAEWFVRIDFSLRTAFFFQLALSRRVARKYMAGARIMRANPLAKLPNFLHIRGRK
jgi:hypothetical protein